MYIVIFISGYIQYLIFVKLLTYDFTIFLSPSDLTFQSVFFFFLLIVGVE